jgi:hypothetical protein
MDLESGLYQINFCSRRKTALSQTRYLAINFSNFGMEDEEYPRFGGGPKPWKMPEPWKDTNIDSCPTLKPIVMPKIPPLMTDFPNSGFQFHLHESPFGLITGGKIKPYGNNKDAEYPLTGYQSAMGDLYARLLRIKKVEPEEE